MPSNVDLTRNVFFLWVFGTVIGVVAREANIQINSLVYLLRDFILKTLNPLCMGD